MNDSKVARLIRWRHGEKPGPWEIVLFPTNRCNQRCNICWQRWVETERGGVDYSGELSDERILRLVDEAKEMDVREWSIVGGGDPMIRADLVMELCGQITNHGMTGELYTNGTLFKPEHLEHLVRVGWPRVGISLDGGDALTNDAIRSEGSFDRATRNIRLLNDLRRRHGVDKPQVALHAVVTSLNYDKIDRIVELAHELECSDLGVAPLVIHGDVNRSFALSPDQEAQFPTHLTRAIQVADRLHVPSNMATMLPRENPLSGGMNRLNAAGNREGRFLDALCFEPWLTLVIIAEGARLGPCCVSWEQDADSFHGKTLREAWEGTYMDGIRRRILTHQNVPDYCRCCPWHIVTRTDGARTELRAKLDAEWAAMGSAARAQVLAGRFISNLRGRGLRQTLRRAREWIQLHR